MGDGDGWVRCDLGHRHWGRFGAAGILINDGGNFVLQHRAPWTHEGDTWGIPGGARDSHEDAVQAATREAVEEAAVDPASVRATGLLVDDHGGWSYTTVLARPQHPINPHAANAESTQIRWWPESEIAQLPLHRGFAGTWPRLRSVGSPVALIVDTHAAVAGVVPLPQGDDTAMPVQTLLETIYRLARFGISDRAEPDSVSQHSVSQHSLDALLPRIVLIGSDLPETESTSEWWQASVTLHRVRDSERAAAVEQACLTAFENDERVLVVSEESLQSTGYSVTHLSAIELATLGVSAVSAASEPD
ncbi:ADP-ribose pyrophosphatase YjhB (NUDIX family) [Jatrophihabitans sp. GAS493]|uniref:NUDIX hydrolase n=1 Tax=Jatrophihabitans sp. GAS493 TaxID=1907575 RepID=UPI000BB84013|nr:NUDIX hydrolase [Jatrophihabitans sp. GAS493]SOD74106.1 ADP-ribose pyrophosphatase YjhB (NUDIX family) [Jatrophihabitans sp. GAS493]